jgi:hypothetical protein
VTRQLPGSYEVGEAIVGQQLFDERESESKYDSDRLAGGVDACKAVVR